MNGVILSDHPAIRRAELEGMPEPTAVYICHACGEAINAGEVYVEFLDRHYHLECAQDEALALLIEECGAISGIAEAGAIC